MRTARVYLLFLLVAIAGCRDRDSSATPVDENLIPREEALARFRSGMEPVVSLAGGAPSVDSLIARFIHALETSDTADLVRMAITREEFAFLYYPTNPQSMPPYDLRPGLMWFMHQTGSDRGLSRLLSDRAGVPLGFQGYHCDQVTSQQGENLVSGPCVIRRVSAPGDTVEERLFGLVLQRNGETKFVSYSNSLD
jgi:hypothetical protein